MTIEDFLKPKAKKETTKNFETEPTAIVYLKMLWFLLLASTICKGLLFIWPT